MKPFFITLAIGMVLVAMFAAVLFTYPQQRKCPAGFVYLNIQPQGWDSGVCVMGAVRPVE